MAGVSGGVLTTGDNVQEAANQDNGKIMHGSRMGLKLSRISHAVVYLTQAFYFFFIFFFPSFLSTFDEHSRPPSFAL